MINQYKEIFNSSFKLRSLSSKKGTLYNEIFKKTNFLDTNATLRQRLWHLINNEPPCCKECGGSVKWDHDKYRKFCSKKCSANNANTKKNRKNTNLEKYGAECSLSNNEVRAKREKTLIKKYGVKHPLQSNHIMEKLKETNQERYGSNYSLENKSVRQKMQDTCLKNHGVKNPFESKEIQQKIKDTNLEKYDTSNPSKNPEVIEKINRTCLERYGRLRSSQSHIPKEILAKIDNPTWLETEHKTKTLTTISKETGVSVTQIAQRFSKYNLIVSRKNISLVEQEIFSFIRSIYSGEIIQSDRTILSPKEIDILIPSMNLGFEINGVYWHSEVQGKDANYHLNKTKLAENNKVRLIHIFDSEWIHKQEIVKSRITSLLGHNRVIYGRKTIIKEITSGMGLFLDNNHIQGNAQSSKSYGLYYEDELVAMMTFGKPRYNKKYEYELIRFCNKMNTTVIGGASKLYNHFVKQNSPKSIISYSDKRWNTGNLYEILGMTKVSESKPNYYYFKDDVLESRIKYQKHKLINLLEKYDPELTEADNMYINGYNRIWDCGNDVFVQTF